MTHSHPQDAQKVKQGMHFVADILMKKANELVADHREEFADFVTLYHGLAKLGFDGFPKAELTLWAELSEGKRDALAQMKDYSKSETVNEFGRNLQVVARLACINLTQETIYYMGEEQHRGRAIRRLGELADIQEPKAKEKAAQDIIDTELKFIDRRISQSWKEKFRKKPHQNNERQCAVR